MRLRADAERDGIPACKGVFSPLAKPAASTHAGQKVGCQRLARCSCRAQFRCGHHTWGMRRMSIFFKHFFPSNFSNGVPAPLLQRRMQSHLNGAPSHPTRNPTSSSSSGSSTTARRKVRA